MGVGILKYLSLMSIFPISLPSQVAMIRMILDLISHTPDSYDPWMVPHLSVIDFLGYSMLLSPTEVAYDSIQSSSENTSSDDKYLVALDPYCLPS